MLRLWVEGLAAREQVLRIQLQRWAAITGYVGSGSSAPLSDAATSGVLPDDCSSRAFGADTGEWRSSNPPDRLLTIAAWARGRTIWAGSWRQMAQSEALVAAAACGLRRSLVKHSWPERVRCLIVPRARALVPIAVLS